MEQYEQQTLDRIRSRVDRGDLLAQLLLMARGDSAQVQSDYIDSLAVLASTIRKIFLESGIIQKLDYRPREFWPEQNGNCRAARANGPLCFAQYAGNYPPVSTNHPVG